MIIDYALQTYQEDELCLFITESMCLDFGIIFSSNTYYVLSRFDIFVIIKILQLIDSL